MNQFIKIFRKVGGKEILRQYYCAHVLFFALLTTIILGFSKKSLEIVRLAVNNKVLNKLRKQYKGVIETYLVEQQNDNILKIHSNKVWICWFQGMDNAPEIVRRCYQSLLDNLRDKEIILITEYNYRDYVQFPVYIQDKINKGIISITHTSDLLRIELLTRYGGTWIDSTVYCSGGNVPDYMMNLDLFVFQNLKPGLDGHSTCASNWFITSVTNEPILKLTLVLLYEYWKKYDKLMDYYIFHNMFQLAIETYPEEWRKVVPFSNSVPHILLLRLFEKYDEKIWNAINESTCFHKLSYKFEKNNIFIKGTYYDKVLGI